METKFKYFLNENVTPDFKKVYKTILTYIKSTCNSETQINEYVPNTHIAETFRDVLIACECESKYPTQFYKIPNSLRNGGSNYVPDNIKDDYYEKDVLYYKKGTFKISFIDLIPEYFDLNKLNKNGDIEIHRVYQKLREKKDKIRNLLMLYKIYLPPEYTGAIDYTKPYKDKLKANRIKIK